MNKKSYDEVQKKLEKNPFDQVIPMITKDIPSYKKLNSEEEKILIRLEELYKMKMQYMSIPEEKKNLKEKFMKISYQAKSNVRKVILKNNILML